MTVVSFFEGWIGGFGRPGGSSTGRPVVAVSRDER